MCYNTRISRKKKELESQFKVKALFGEMKESDELVYDLANGFSHPNMWIIPQEKPENMIPVKWGFIPHYQLGADYKTYYKEQIRFGSGLNAKSEKLFSSNNYKKSALKRRCIIPVDGFFEPHRIENKKPYSIPFYFHRKDHQFINLAGIYAVTPDKMVTFSILTKAATPLFSKIHNKKNRRPVMVQDGRIKQWLDTSSTETEIQHLIENDMADEQLKTYPVSTDVYKRGAGDRSDVIEAVNYTDIEIDY